tara:strand:+ start:54855 stop:56630 length:1776 start_codon:yes stop_codon:yes gene_type:complete
MNKANQIKQALLAIGVLGMFQPVMAQTSPSKKDSLSSETVVIVREFEPVIKDAKKINHQPVLNEISKKTPTFSYEMIPQNQQYKFNPDTIDAVKIKGEPLNDLYRGYAKIGAGNYLNNLGELHLNSVRSRDFQWGLDARHLGSKGGIKNLPDNSFSKQNVNLYGRKLLKHHAINGGFTFDREQINKYGLNRVVNADYPISSNYTDSLKQTYLLYQANAGIKSFNADANLLNYKINFTYHNLAVNPANTKETNFLMNSEFSKYFGTEKGYFYLDVDYNKLKSDSLVNGSEYKANLLIKPSINVEFKGSKWRLIAGFKMGFENEKKNQSEAKFYFFPNAEFKFNVVKNLIIPYLGITGNVKRNSFNSLRLENPFLTALPELKTSKTTYDAYVGVRGLISSNLSYNISAGYKKVKDMVLYNSYQGPDLTIPVTNPTYFENVYSPIYDTVNIAHVSAQVNYQREDKWNLMWRLNYNNYETQREAKAWNLPDFTSDVTLRYSLQDKIIAKSSITFMSSKYVRTDDVTQEEVAHLVYGRKIDPIIDLNVGLEYRFTKRISAFVDVNNILSQNYEIWGNYQVQGINVMGGVTFAFWKK